MNKIIQLENLLTEEEREPNGHVLDTLESMGSIGQELASSVEDELTGAEQEKEK